MTTPPAPRPKIAVVFGTRPEAIKMAPLVLALRQAQDMEVRVIVTAQHRQMLDQVLELFEIAPDDDLDLMQPGQSLSALTGRVLAAMDGPLEAHRPDLVLVHGDTTTTLGASLSAYYHQIPVGHVEAGLRTYDRWAPWPEEINRQLTGRVAELHFAPTERARGNLLAEATPPGQVHVTGNTVIDALQWVSARLEARLAAGDLDLRALLAQNVSGQPLEARAQAALEAVAAGRRRMVLITGHRRENLGDGFVAICSAVRALAGRHPQVEFVYPVHLNPRVQEPVHAILGGLPNVHLIPPLDYLPFVHLMTLCALVLTDSGGIQEEAPGLGRPVLVMREVTERPEGVEAGTVALVGTDQARIEGAVERLLTDTAAYEAMATAVNPFGDGRACERILAAIRGWWAERPSQRSSS